MAAVKHNPNKTVEKLSYYPVSLNIMDKKVLLLGGGRDVLLESQGLMENGAYVDIVSKNCLLEVKELAKTHSHRLKVFSESKEFLKTLPLNKYALIFAYSKDPAEKGVLVTAKYAGGDFLVPRRLRRGHLKISVSTDGLSRSLERVLISKIEADSVKELDDYALFLDFVKEKVDSLPTPLTKKQNELMQKIVEEVSGKDEVSGALRRNSFLEATRIFERSLTKRLEESSLVNGE